MRNSCRSRRASGIPVGFMPTVPSPAGAKVRSRRRPVLSNKSRSAPCRHAACAPTVRPPVGATRQCRFRRAPSLRSPPASRPAAEYAGMAPPHAGATAVTARPPRRPAPSPTSRSTKTGRAGCARVATWSAGARWRYRIPRAPGRFLTGWNRREEREGALGSRQGAVLVAIVNQGATHEPCGAAPEPAALNSAGQLVVPACAAGVCAINSARTGEREH